MEKIYNPKRTEDKWYNIWLKKKFFHSEPEKNKTAYTVVIPPPNVTGVLHMGHMLNNTIQDVLVRRARMKGFNACWVPGTDHASIATEAKVAAMLKKKGIDKKIISREEFLKHAWEWKEKHGGIILDQLKKLGCSCDWDRTKFTMQNDLSDAVIDVFIDLYEKGYIYRGLRMVNWDPQALTAVSDEEVIYKEVNSKLYFLKYFIEGEKENFVAIATTRPETILGDTAVCINPNDERYKHLKGKKVLVPLINRAVPVIFDEYVDMEFGTGALKVTPAHDANDYQLGVKHKLQIVDIFNDNGTLNKNAQLYVGEDRFAVRKKISIELLEKGYLIKSEDMVNKVGYSERTDAVIEPKLSVQWFLKMKELSKPALENVMNDNIKFYPEKFKNSYRYWMENVRDWCISRQLWWGHRIPAWYCSCHECCDIVMIQKTKPEKCIRCGCSAEIYQDEDVLDTWFSSWLWPISVFDAKFLKEKNSDLQYYYPTNDLVTAPEIMFFWVARMIIAGYEYLKKPPFKNVYYTGIVRDKIGRKMSKSLGNSPEPLELIEKYGADGVRVGMLLCSPAGNDLLFDEALCEQGRNFTNKIWNAFRLVKGWTVDEKLQQSQGNKIVVEWFNAKLNSELSVLEKAFDEFRISEALMLIYKLFWDDFCSWYLEMIKPEFVNGKQNSIDKLTYDSTINFFEKLLKILHPFMPFITEEIWHLIRERNDYIIVAEYPKVDFFDLKKIKEMDIVFNEINLIRSFRSNKKIRFEHKIKCPSYNASFLWKYDEILKKICNIMLIKIEKKEEIPLNYILNSSGTVYLDEFNTQQSTYAIYFDLTGINIEKEPEKIKLLNDLEYYRGFLNSVQKKLDNEKFLANAKSEVISNEKKKQADAEAKIKAIEEQLDAMGK